MKRILLSLMTISLVAAVGVAATRAFFSDVETSTGNTFTAGGLDLKVDSDCHYFQDTNADGVFENVGCSGFGTWTETDLGAEKFFNFTDIKPGEYGEDTVSLHVYNNDAWGRLVISGVTDLENTCTESELEVETGCSGDTDGELRENLRFWVWLDQGMTPGFQGKETDTYEGDNIQEDEAHEPTIIFPGDIDAGGETWYLADALAGREGFTSDGHMESSVTYYFGIGWDLPATVGNDVQTDSLEADFAFEVEQYRNNPSPFPTP